MHISCTLCTTHVSCRVSCRVSTGRGGRGAPSRPPARTGLCGPPACDRLQQVHATRDALHRAMNASQTCHLSHSVSLTAKLELHVELVLLLVLLRQTRHHILHHLARGCTRGQTHRVLRAIAAGEEGEGGLVRRKVVPRACGACVADSLEEHVHQRVLVLEVCMHERRTDTRTRSSYTQHPASVYDGQCAHRGAVERTPSLSSPAVLGR